MLAELIMLTPGCQNEFIDCPKAKVRIAVLPIMDVKIHLNSTLELLEHAYQLWEFTCGCLQKPKFNEYRQHVTTQDQWTIVKYVMEVMRPFQYWSLWMLNTHPVTLHQVITVYNNMFYHMDGVMQALAKIKTQWKEDLFFAMKLAQKKLAKY
jgi:hypothetical protein